MSTVKFTDEEMIIAGLLHDIGKDRNLTDKYKDHEYYKDTLNFCEKWDQASFDPNYKSLTLKNFEPIVRKIFSRKPYKN